MTIGERIRNARKNKGYSQSELAELIGYKSRSSVNKMENEGRAIPRKIILKLSEALGVTPTYLMGWDEDADTVLLNFDNIKPVQLRKFPMLGKIACGEPIFAQEEKESYVMADMNINADFCLTARGDSMINARINDGDIVFIRSAPTVSNGDIAAVIINNEATLKRVYYYPDNNKLVLAPENSNYQPLVYINEELEKIRILGKAVYFMSAL